MFFSTVYTSPFLLSTKKSVLDAKKHRCFFAAVLRFIMYLTDTASQSRKRLQDPRRWKW